MIMRKQAGILIQAVQCDPCSALTGTGGVAGACSGGFHWKGLGQDSPFKRHSRAL
jgi:hypothetical protein